MIIDQPSINRVLSLAIPIPANTVNGSQINLTYDGVIQNANTYVQQVETVDSDSMANGQQGANGYSESNFTLTLVDTASVEKTKDLPFGLINPAINGGNPREFTPFQINLQGSFIRYTGSQTPPTGTIYLMFYISTKDQLW